MTVGEVFRYVEPDADCRWMVRDGMIFRIRNGLRFSFRAMPVRGLPDYATAEEACVASKATAPLLPVYECVLGTGDVMFAALDSPDEVSCRFRKLCD